MWFLLTDGRLVSIRIERVVLGTVNNYTLQCIKIQLQNKHATKKGKDNGHRRKCCVKKIEKSENSVIIQYKAKNNIWECNTGERVLKMEEIFQRIIEIENRAKEVYEDAKQEEKRKKEAFFVEMKKKESEIQLMAEEKIKQLAMRSKEETKEKIDRMDRFIEEKLSHLEVVFDTNRNEWEDTIFRKVIGE